MPPPDNKPVLILQDTDAEDYDDNGILFSETDPYKVCDSEHIAAKNSNI